MTFPALTVDGDYRSTPVLNHRPSEKVPSTNFHLELPKILVIVGTNQSMMFANPGNRN